MLHDFETTSLRAFVAVSETKNFSIAARILHRTQPAISQQIKKLEENTKRKLFLRRNNNVELTTDGEKLLKYAKKIVSLYEAARNSMAMQLPTIELRVGAPDDYFYTFLQQPLDCLQKEFPATLINVTCGNSRDIVRKFELGELDIGFVATDPQITFGKTLRIDDLSWVASDPKLMEAHVLPLSGFPKGCHVRDAMISALEGAGKTWRFIFTSDCISTIRHHVASGRSITALEKSLIPDQVVDIGLDSVLPGLPQIRIAMLNKKTQSSELEVRLADLVCSNFGI